MDQIEDDVSKLQNIASDCSNLIDNDENKENTNKRLYLNQEMNDIKETLNELTERMENVKYMLYMDKVSPGEMDYMEMIDKKIESNRAYKRFIDFVGPYMVLFDTLQFDE